jgi:hypothetical protein
MSEDGDAQMVFWNNLNDVMRRHGVEKPEFKGFMADGAQANWNAVRAVYGGGQTMTDKERTCLFHYVQSMIKYTEKWIADEFQEQHKSLCKQYRDASTIEDADRLFDAL